MMLDERRTPWLPWTLVGLGLAGLMLLILAGVVRLSFVHLRSHFLVSNSCILADFVLVFCGGIGVIWLLAEGWLALPWLQPRDWPPPGPWLQFHPKLAPSAGALVAEQERRILDRARKALVSEGLVGTPLGDALVVGFQSADGSYTCHVIIRLSLQTRSIHLSTRTKRAVREQDMQVGLEKANTFNRRLAIGRVYVDNDRELMVDYSLSLRGRAQVPANLAWYVKLLASVAQDLVRETKEITEEMRTPDE